MQQEEDYHGTYADIYVLMPTRSKAFIHSFLDRFVLARKESTDEYEIPQYSDNPTIIYRTADELMDHLEKNEREVHTIYWTNTERSTLQGAECFFTNDGNVIVGLSTQIVYTDGGTYPPDTSIEDRYFAELKEFCGSDNGYVTYENVPPVNVVDFMKLVEAFKSERDGKGARY